MNKRSFTGFKMIAITRLNSLVIFRASLNNTSEQSEESKTPVINPSLR